MSVAVAVDRFGNVYVTGRSTELPYGLDFVTIKYDPSGLQRWVQRYDGGGDDAPSAIAVDTSGNVYVAGTSQATAGRYDYVTIKYSTEGQQQWAARCVTSLSSLYPAPALAVDRSGAAYVAGASRTPDGAASSAITVKYNGDGVQQWAEQYAWPGNANNWATSLAVDTDGNVCVVGGTQDSSASGADVTNDDYLTIKYSRGGHRMWVQRYDGPRHENDEPAAIGTDASGNIYVSGSSTLSGTDPNWSDWTTVKYSSSGVQLWARQYNGPDNSVDIAYALAVDPVGNVYVAGGSDGQGSFGDFLTIKYDSGGVEQWIDRYNGPANDHDEATAIVLDASGNVHVTGRSRSIGTQRASDDYLTIKSSPSGIRQWVARYDGPGHEYDQAAAVAVDASGNVLVTGRSEAPKGDVDYATIKYSSSGVEQWVARYDGPGNSYESVTALAIDPSGNVYLTGTSGSWSYNDYCTVKYSSEGVLQWAARYNGTADLYDYPTAITVDHSGNVYVTGESDGPNTRRDYATIKYNSAGVQQWVARYNAPGNLPDRSEAIEVDRFGNVYVSGTAFHTSSGVDASITTIKYDAEGREQWIVVGPGSYYGDPVGLSVDGSGNVYIAGSTRASSSTGRDYVTVKYNPDGVQVWAKTYSGPANLTDLVYASTIDRSGSVYVTGSSWRADYSTDVVTIKYDPKGQEKWVARYDGPSTSSGFPSFDRPRGLAVDQFGNVYIVVAPFTTVKYDSKGTQLWAKNKLSTGGIYAELAGLALDALGAVYVTGLAESYPTSEQVIAKYDGEGNEQWVLRHEALSPVGVAVDSWGNVYTPGVVSGSGWSIFSLMKCVQSPGGLDYSGGYWLAQNYPNPFNSATTFRYSLPFSSHVSLKLFNVLGQLVTTIVSSDQVAGIHEITFGSYSLASGVYFYRLHARPTETGQAGDFVEMKKLILLK
jgi:uncharacterized delta-60 repeat protein